MFQNIPKDKILDVVKQGPTIPQKIVKIVGGDTMLIGAILSTMISTGEVKYSVLKVGGSPLYYIPDHESRLEEFISYLNDKDQKIVKILKEKKILQDSKQEPLTRVSLKSSKDFAKPFEAVISGKKELFYRYFLVPKDEAELLALEIENQERLLLESAAKSNIASDTSSQAEKIVKDNPTPIIIDREISANISNNSVMEEKIVEKNPIHSKKPVHRKKSDTQENFFEKIVKQVHSLGLDIINKEKIKKTEYALVLKNHDSNEYHYAVAKDKKTINEGDLSTAFVFAHTKKMPCIFMMTGNLTKKAESMAKKEFKDMQIESI